MKYFDTKKDSLEEAISKAINEKPEQLKEARYEIKFDSGEFGQDDEDDYADMLQGELEGKRIRVKVGPGSKNNTLSFDTNVPKAKLKKVIEDDLGYYVNESSEYYSNPNAKDLLEAGGKYLKYSDLLLQKGRLLAKNQNTAMIDKEISKEMKKLGIKEATGDKEKYEKFFKAALKKFGVDSPADFKDDAKKKEFFNYVDKNYKGDHEESVDLEEENLQEGMNADTAKAILKMRAKDKFEIFRGDYVPMIYLSNADRQALKDAGHKMTRDIPKPTTGQTATSILNVANGSTKDVNRAGMYDTETDDMKGKNPAVINMKKFVRGDFQKIGHPKTVGDLVKMTGLRLNSNDPSKNEEVDNSLMAQATRVISHTSIKEKIDPADIDNIATADDRKAADKNIIIQLRRAQDMQGKADVTFKDKPNKKEKIDIRVINKALDMFDKMRPNDKAKMQTTIGKSYRDLLKTVQRGRI